MHLIKILAIYHLLSCCAINANYMYLLGPLEILAWGDCLVSDYLGLSFILVVIRLKVLFVLLSLVLDYSLFPLYFNYALLLGVGVNYLIYI